MEFCYVFTWKTFRWRSWRATRPFHRQITPEAYFWSRQPRERLRCCRLVVFVPSGFAYLLWGRTLTLEEDRPPHREHLPTEGRFCRLAPQIKNRSRNTSQAGWKIPSCGNAGLHESGGNPGGSIERKQNHHGEGVRGCRCSGHGNKDGLHKLATTWIITRWPCQELLPFLHAVGVQYSKYAASTWNGAAYCLPQIRNRSLQVVGHAHLPGVAICSIRCLASTHNWPSSDAPASQFSSLQADISWVRCTYLTGQCLASQAL